MAKRTRNQATAVAVVGFVLAAGGPLLAADHEARTLVLHVANYAGVPDADLAEAEAVANRVYEAIGVRISWVSGLAGPDDRNCRVLHLTVVLTSLDTTPGLAGERNAENILGSAYNNAGRAYIFTERVGALAARKHVDGPVLLGRAIAHEIGHLVLTESGHANIGIMSASPNVHPTSFRPTFTPPQGRDIRRLLATRTVAASEKVPGHTHEMNN